MGIFLIPFRPFALIAREFLGVVGVLILSTVFAVAFYMLGWWAIVEYNLPLQWMYQGFWDFASVAAVASLFPFALCLVSAYED